MMMHHSVPSGHELKFLPAMYSFSGPNSLLEFDFGPPNTPGHLQRPTITNNSWETRCLRKHRRRVDDEGCTAKKRRLMVEEDPISSTHQVWPSTNRCHSLSAKHVSTKPPQSSPGPQPLTLPRPAPILHRSEAENSCMEIEAAQRKLQKIKDRIALKDDDEEEDLEIEPAPRRPVLVISDSLKEGLQWGISDILPQKVAQSMSHSCMELVLWCPPEDHFCPRLKDALQKQRKQETLLRHPPAPCPSPIPHSSLSSSSPSIDTHSLPYIFPVAHSPGEEDMEM